MLTYIPQAALLAAHDYLLWFVLILRLDKYFFISEVDLHLHLVLHRNLRTFTETCIVKKENKLNPIL